MKGAVDYYDDREGKIKEMKIELELGTWWDEVTGWLIWAEGKCPFDGTPLSFDVITDEELSSDVRRMIKEIAELKEDYVKEGSGEELQEMINDVLWRYSEFPTETEVAGKCIHFNPRKYLDEEEEEEIGEWELAKAEAGVAIVDGDEVVKEILQGELEEIELAIREFEREYGHLEDISEDIRKLNEIKRKLK
jgi:hypothetical protein